MLTPTNQLNDTGLLYLRKNNRRIIFIYFLLIAVLLGAILSLPFLYIDISLVAPGVIRPYFERTEIKSSISGHIQRIHYKEGTFINKDSVIISLRSGEVQAKYKAIDTRLRKLQEHINDLKLLAGSSKTDFTGNHQLTSSLYKQALSSFRQKVQEHRVLIRKAEEELRVNQFLYKEKVISQLELFNSEVELQKLIAAFKSYYGEKLFSWQEQLSALESAYVQLKVEKSECDVLNASCQVKAPISGVVQFLQSNYAGSYINAGETFCLISPESSLIAECIMSGKDVALVKESQKVLFRIDAFNYSYFGMLTGRILSIDNDYTVVNNQPAFKVRCSFDADHLMLKNGFTGHLKKGLTLEANFILTRRTLWQLLFDKLDDWLIPHNYQVS